MTRIQQRILHPGHLFLHGLKRFTNDGRAHPLRTQVAHFLDLQEVEKRIVFRDSHQPGFFPAGQLARREPQNPNQVRTTISVHGCWYLCYALSGTCIALGNRKAVLRGLLLLTAT